MRTTIIGMLLLMLFVNRATAQQDSVAFTTDARMNDGVYLSYSDFRKNDAISKAQIKSPLDTGQLNFIEKTLDRDKKFSYSKNGIAYTVSSKSVWAFFQNNTLYLNYEGEFYRVPTFGSISHLVAMVSDIRMGVGPVIGYGGGMAMGPTYSKEPREFIMDFYDGQLQSLSMDHVKALLSRDPALYAEYKALSSRKRKEEMYRYIRRYNALHPVYFLK